MPPRKRRLSDLLSDGSDTEVRPPAFTAADVATPLSSAAGQPRAGRRLLEALDEGAEVPQSVVVARPAAPKKRQRGRPAKTAAAEAEGNAGDDDADSTEVSEVGLP
jgi:hypothetical protein